MATQAAPGSEEVAHTAPAFFFQHRNTASKIGVNETHAFQRWLSVDDQ